MMSKIIFTLGCAVLLYFVLSAVFFWGYNLAILALGLVMVMLSIKGFRNRISLMYKRLKKPVKILIIAVVSLGLASFIFIEGLIISGEGGGGMSEKADYLMILGASLRGEKLSRSLENRLDKGLEYLQKYPGTKVIVSGGQGMNEGLTEAEAMKRYLVEHGVDPGTIIKEDKSTSTHENFKFTRQLLQKNGQFNNRKFVVVTNDFHMFRSRMLAKWQSFDAVPLPCRTNWYLAPNCYVREYFAVVKTFIFDRH